MQDVTGLVACLKPFQTIRNDFYSNERESSLRFGIFFYTTYDGIRLEQKNDNNKNI